jgi:hypothetical protein
MALRRKKNKAIPFEVPDIANITKSNPYIQQLIEDASLRDNVRGALDSTKRIYERLSDGKTTAATLLEDKKMQAEVRRTVEAIRDITTALTEAPKAQARKGRRVGRTLALAAVGGGVAMAGSAPLRSKVLDLLFGAEQEFEYTPPADGPLAPVPPAEQTPAGAA